MQTKTFKKSKIGSLWTTKKNGKLFQKGKLLSQPFFLYKNQQREAENAPTHKGFILVNGSKGEPIFIELVAFWEQSNKFLISKSHCQGVFSILPNQKKKSPNSPDYYIFLNKRENAN